MTYVNIEGKDGLVRDISSGAILNTNQAEYENYLAKRKRAQEERDKMRAQEMEINNLRNELADIKQLLVTFIKKQNG